MKKFNPKIASKLAKELESVIKPIFNKYAELNFPINHISNAIIAVAIRLNEMAHDRKK